MERRINGVFSPETAQAVESLAETFIRRWDLYAQQLEDGRYACIKQPLTYRHILAHLQGQITLGTYLLDKDSQAKFAVMDADNNTDFQKLIEISISLDTQNIPCYIETSRRGGHLWFFFEDPRPADKAREFGEGLKKAFHEPKVEFFPKQDKLHDGPGSLIRVPFGIHRITHKRYGFITYGGRPLATSLREQLAILAIPQTVPEWAFEKYKLHQSGKPRNAFPKRPCEATDNIFEQIRESISLGEFIGQFIELKPSGGSFIGFCPFHEDNHRSLGVNVKGNYWHCFAGCGGGSIIDFWMKYRKINLITAVTELRKILLE